MRKVFLTILVIAFLVAFTSPSYALIRTRNVDIDEGGFRYKVAYQYITPDVGETTTLTNVRIAGEQTDATNYSYTMPFKGSLVGISIASSSALTAGSITVDATINGTVTGLRTALNYHDGSVKHYPSGGNTDSRQYNYNTIVFDDDSPDDWGGAYHDSTHQYGKITELVAGDYIGVQIQTSATMTPSNSDIVITVIVLQ